MIHHIDMTTVQQTTMVPVASFLLIASLLAAINDVRATFTPPATVCADHCTSCATFGERTCDTNGCASGYIFNNAAITPYNNWCIPCPASCGGAANCPDLGSTDGVCGTCPYYQGGSPCTGCSDPNCLLCPDDANVCIECYAQFGLDSNNQCVQGALSCGVYGQYVTLCTECLYIENTTALYDGTGSCGGCGPHCVTTPLPISGCMVSGGGLCDTCQPPYVANSDYVCVIPTTMTVPASTTRTKPPTTTTATTTTKAPTTATTTTSTTTTTTKPSTTRAPATTTKPSTSTTKTTKATTTTKTSTTTTQSVCPIATTGDLASCIPRCMWNTVRPNLSFTPIKKLPVSVVVIHHTFTQSCSNINYCSTVVRNLEIQQITQRGVSDIAYNFLIGGDGNIYVGRGWDVVGHYIDTPTYAAWNYNSTGIAFVGEFNVLVPTKLAIAAYNRLVALGIKYGHISPSYTLYAHYDIECTDCPGFALRNTIKYFKNYRKSAPTYCAPNSRTWLHPM